MKRNNNDPRSSSLDLGRYRLMMSSPPPPSSSSTRKRAPLSKRRIGSSSLAVASRDARASAELGDEATETFFCSKRTARRRNGRQGYGLTISETNSAVGKLALHRGLEEEEREVDATLDHRREERRRAGIFRTTFSRLFIFVVRRRQEYAEEEEEGLNNNNNNNNNNEEKRKRKPESAEECRARDFTRTNTEGEHLVERGSGDD